MKWMLPSVLPGDVAIPHELRTRAVRRHALSYHRAVKRLTLMLVVCAATAQQAPVPGWGLSGMNRVRFGVKVDREVAHGGASSARMECFAKHCDTFATLMQTIKADEYLGQRIRLSAWAKAADAGRPRLWMRVDGPNGETLAFDNMDNRSKSGSFDWRPQQVVLDVGKHAALINFGFMLQDRGIAWVDDVTLEVVDRSVKDTAMSHGGGSPQGDPRAIRARWERSSSRPVNLDFEQE
jgi:hypothetical protein